jgi:hypothetical protein
MACRIAEVAVPLVDGELAGDQGGGFVVAVVEQFQQVALVGVDQWGQAEIVDD